MNVLVGFRLEVSSSMSSAKDGVAVPALVVVGVRLVICQADEASNDPNPPETEED